MERIGLIHIYISNFKQQYNSKIQKGLKLLFVSEQEMFKTFSNSPSGINLKQEECPDLLIQFAHPNLPNLGTPARLRPINRLHLMQAYQKFTNARREYNSQYIKGIKRLYRQNRPLKDSSTDPKKKKFVFVDHNRRKKVARYNIRTTNNSQLRGRENMGNQTARMGQIHHGKPIFIDIMRKERGGRNYALDMGLGGKTVDNSQSISFLPTIKSTTNIQKENKDETKQIKTIIANANNIDPVYIKKQPNKSSNKLLQEMNEILNDSPLKREENHTTKREIQRKSKRFSTLQAEIAKRDSVTETHKGRNRKQIIRDMKENYYGCPQKIRSKRIGQGAKSVKKLFTEMDKIEFNI